MEQIALPKPINTYEVWCQNQYGETWCHGEYSAETAGKAKYSHWLYMQDGIWEEPFGDVVRHLRSRKIGGFKVSDLFGNPERFQRVIEQRGITFARMGMRIEVDGKMGTIVGSNHSGNLDVCFEGQWWKENCHPWWKTRYFDRKGNLIKDYTEV